ncbi:MAG: hypothetical protein IJE89_02895 [Bacilli bacterium]|nr:hypothetical protein [Bacilli bacterium]
MRDSFGGVFMTNLFLVFIFIYVAFTAVSLNYAKAYRVKNSIIDFIEENEIIDFNSSNFRDKTSKLDEILANANYNKTCSDGNGNVISAEGKIEGYCYNGIVILKDREEIIEGTNSKNIYYKVLTYADWNLGALNKILALGGRQENSEDIVSGTWEITGEAKVVVKK